MTLAPKYPDLDGAAVLITGGGSGIGAALTAGCAAQGARVAFLDIAEEPSRDLCDRVERDSGRRPLFLRCDLRDVDALKAGVAEAEKAHGAATVLINNAANDDRHTVDEVTPEYWDDRMAVNLKHQFFAAKAVHASMRDAGGGSIINLGSISWHLGLPDLAIYQTAKAAIEGLTRSLAREWGRENIRVNAIIPGNVQTPRQMKWYTPEGEAEIVAQQCLDGRIQPADVAALAMFLASDDARFCTGHNYWVDAGWR